MSKSVIIVGGTGFLGYHAIQEFITKGWEVTALGLPPAPPANLFPPAVKVILKSLDSTQDEELLTLLRGHDALVFAAGLDDRAIPQKPAYPKFIHANVETPLRLFQLAVKAGVRRAVVLGSYFAHFNRLWPGGTGKSTYFSSGVGILRARTTLHFRHSSRNGLEAAVDTSHQVYPLQ
jgi:dihydroflavonol-4-reductase